MSGQLPVVTGKDIVRVLLKKGWILLHVRGSHHQMEFPETGQRIAIAVHAGKGIHRGLLRAILQKVELSPAEFRRLL